MEKITNKEKRFLKLNYHLTLLVFYSFISLLIFLFSLIIWGIVEFVFKEYTAINNLTTIKNDVMMYCTMIPFIFNAALCLISLIFFCFLQIIIKKIRHKYEIKNENIYQTNPVASTLYYTSNLSTSDASKLASSALITKEGIKSSGSLIDSAYELIIKFNIKTNTLFTTIGIWITIICSLILITLTIAEGIVARNTVINYMNNEYISNVVDKVESTFSNLEVNIDKELSKDGKEMEYKVTYGNVNIFLDSNLKDNFKIEQVSFGYYLDDEEANLINSETIESEIKFLFQQLSGLNGVMVNDDILNYEIQFSEDFQFKINNLQIGEHWNNSIENNGFEIYESINVYDVNDIIVSVDIYYSIG